MGEDDYLLVVGFGSQQSAARTGGPAVLARDIERVTGLLFNGLSFLTDDDSDADSFRRQFPSMLMSCVRFSLEGLPRGLFPDSYPSQDLPGAVEVKVLYHLDLIAAFLDKSQEEMMRGH